ncbi:hypothetical protein, unlikely [Trypanosoma brucei gambiense DAL972]|uniref:Uncharacterized protein n=1 Tax=Trypanosoma brucei gambiense (strain MHOM/CI/86/DAL972) TaxID=679716 RepID=C9ZU10_TRYB9|nr:hypothetical protein, unlikely [Trypanosoma brucei gambiense DAL972]CBH12896.1 hypothetical protein, unlikely [Trypanosoma brucei gambiense DAL972]|eukprot:XP_011775175.1 hypothetical protein, unlikely [Trypanosoma brucei gambiense DAL972]
MEFVRPFFLLSLFKFSGIPCFSSRRVPCFFFFVVLLWLLLLSFFPLNVTLLVADSAVTALYSLFPRAYQTFSRNAAPRQKEKCSLFVFFFVFTLLFAAIGKCTCLPFVVVCVCA